MILKRCQELLKQAWGQVRQELYGLWSSLSGVWTMMDKSKNLCQLCSQLDEVLTQAQSIATSDATSSAAQVNTLLSTDTVSRCICYRQEFNNYTISPQCNYNSFILRLSHLSIK